MGLSLNSEEVQKNLALLPVAANVRVCTCHLLFSTVVLASGAAATALKPEPQGPYSEWLFDK